MTVAATKDSQIFWATNAFRLTNPDSKKMQRFPQERSATAMQERDGAIYVFVKQNEESRWMPYRSVMTDAQLKQWIATGGFSQGARR